MAGEVKHFKVWKAKVAAVESPLIAAYELGVETTLNAANSLGIATKALSAKVEGLKAVDLAILRGYSNDHVVAVIKPAEGP